MLQAALQYRALLNRTLLAVPQHLEQIEKYAHCGTLSDDAYRKPWVRACANLKQLQLDDANLQADVAALPGKVVSQVEPFVSDRVLCYNDFGGIYEMVPSSNPESEDSVEDEVLRKLADETELLWDSFEKVDLKELHSTTEEGDEKLLEEVSSTDYLAEFAHQMPALESMVKCLKPQLIKDPFVTDSGSHISEVHVMRSDMLYDNNKEQKHSETDNEEVVIYEKEALLHIEEKMLEEELLPSAVNLEKPQLTVETDFCDSELQNFVTKLKQDIITEDNEPPQVVMSAEFEKLSKFSLAQEGLVESLKAPEKMTTSPVATRDISFTCLNEQGLEEQRDLKTSLLESPTSVNTLPLPTSHTHPWRDLQPLHITPFQEMCFMSPNETQALVKQFWQRERYFNEILSLRLPEPDMTAALENVPLSHVIEKLQLRCEESSGALELELSWDPTAGSTSTVLHALAQDRRLQWSSDTRNVEAGTGDEVFDRAPLQEMHDDEISFPIYVCDGKDKYDCFSTDIPAMKKDQLSDYLDNWHSQQDDASHASTARIRKQPEVASKPTVTRNKSTSGKTTERIKPVIEDPLDQFILLRGGPVSEDSWTGPNVELTSKNATTLTSHPQQETREGLKQPSTPNTPGTPGREGRRRSKSKIIQVQLTDDFQEIHRCLQEAAQPFLSLLKQGGHIPHNRDITAFTPDVTRFILKQHEKSRSDSPAQSDDTCIEVYQAVIVLHCLVSAADVLLHGCLQSAVVQLSSLQVKHQTLLKGQLEGVRQHLLRLQCVHQQVHTQHPKLLVMARNIAEWLVRKKRKSPGHDPKILILSRRSMPSLLESIAESASLVADVNPCVQQVATCHAVLDRLLHCLL
ncbi:hypothetical protein NP493_43g01012 [Ridgeia piscesae]|uniref:Uncharacterized protein n=1 Tax=Ridgeia piscesae TaxID=27915 RepID=A0AAD9PC47_RIDPI|nr:hypothetical protein NP493_43g01012 [Ridgeia piscesae]